MFPTSPSPDELIGSINLGQDGGLVGKLVLPDPAQIHWRYLFRCDAWIDPGVSIDSSCESGKTENHLKSFEAQTYCPNEASRNGTGFIFDTATSAHSVVLCEVFHQSAHHF
jgi:hypothetical protein